jgi:predicted transposase YbfD/YdcC
VSHPPRIEVQLMTKLTVENSEHIVFDVGGRLDATQIHKEIDRRRQRFLSSSSSMKSGWD